MICPALRSLTTDPSGLVRSSLRSNGVTYSSIDQKTGASPITLPAASA